MTDMLQKNENVAKNVADKNSQDLTEQWKKRRTAGRVLLRQRWAK